MKKNSLLKVIVKNTIFLMSLLTFSNCYSQIEPIRNEKCTELSIEEIQNLMAPAWTRFTLIEQQLIENVIETQHQNCFSQFDSLYHHDLPLMINEIVRFFDQIDQNKIYSERESDLKIKALNQLKLVLQKEANAAIEWTQAFIASKGKPNYKTHLAFSHWSQMTMRVFYKMVKIDSHVNPEKVENLLENRMKALHAFAETGVLYSQDPTPQLAKMIRTNEATALDFAEQLAFHLKMD